MEPAEIMWERMKVEESENWRPLVMPRDVWSKEKQKTLESDA